MSLKKRKIMLNDQEVVEKKTQVNGFIGFLKKNGFNIIMLLLILVLIIPDAKSYVLQQLMVTGLFNASMDVNEVDKGSKAQIDFEFVDEKGNLKHTSSLRGKVVFINFWASWCPPCRAECPSIETLYTTFKDNPDVFFLTLNEDSDLATGQAYLVEEGFSVPMYPSRGNIPTQVYSGALPTTVVLDKDGRIRYHHTGFANYAAPKFIEQIESLISK